MIVAINLSFDVPKQCFWVQILLSRHLKPSDSLQELLGGFFRLGFSLLAGSRMQSLLSHCYTDIEVALSPGCKSERSNQIK